MGLGNRRWGAVARAPLQPGHYRALGGMIARYPAFPRELWRYVSGRGSYPYAPRVRTPAGIVAPQLDSSHDLSTVNEVFCRQDYRAGPDLRVAVDVGANIGLASLYFLTRNATARVHMFEPDPKNTARIVRTLAGYEDRIAIHEVAIGLTDGEAAFGVEPVGRYGSLQPADVPGMTQTITVRVREINAVLDAVLAQEPRIDVLKIDVEVGEEQLVEAIRADVLERIDTIYYETDDPAPLHADRFDHWFANQTNRLTRRA